MSTVFDIEQKQDSPEKLAAVANKDPKTVLFAAEFNAIVTKLKELGHVYGLDFKTGINNENPEYVFDVKAPTPVETQLTGTFSFDGMTITGLDTLMLSEIQSGDTIRVLSTGNEYVVEFIDSDTQAYCFSGGNLFENQVCVITVSETKYFNFLELLKSYSQFGNTIRENNEKVVYNKAEIIYNESTQNIQQETNLVNNGSYFHSFRVDGTLAAQIYIVQENGLLGITVRDNNGFGITFFNNHTIKITGLPTSVPSTPNMLYKDSNGFLKIS